MVEESKDEIPESPLSKEEEKIAKTAKEREILIQNLSNNSLLKVKDKVAFILSENIPSRNSDIELCWQYWSYFNSDILKGKSLTKEIMLQLPKMASLSRARAKIQNEYNLFHAKEEVKKNRGKLEESYRESAIEDKPTGIGAFGVYIDETGKNETYLSVGSLWILDNFTAFGALRKLIEWKKTKGIDFEFHFSKLSRGKIDTYKEFFLNFLTFNPTASFKIITVEHKGIKKSQSAIIDLTYHLLEKGIRHEDKSGRAKLPRVLQVNIDPEESGSDKLKLENIKERLRRQSIKGLYIGKFNTLDSKTSMYIQAIDLVVASVNRKINHPESKGKPKDEFANFVLGLLDYPDDLLKDVNKEIDKSIVFNLTQKEE